MCTASGAPGWAHQHAARSLCSCCNQDLPKCLTRCLCVATIGCASHGLLVSHLCAWLCALNCTFFVLHVYILLLLGAGYGCGREARCSVCAHQWHQQSAEGAPASPGSGCSRWLGCCRCRQLGSIMSSVERTYWHNTSPSPATRPHHTAQAHVCACVGTWDTHHSTARTLQVCPSALAALSLSKGRAYCAVQLPCSSPRDSKGLSHSVKMPQPADVPQPADHQQAARGSACHAQAASQLPQLPQLPQLDWS